MPIYGILFCILGNLLVVTAYLVRLCGSDSITQTKRELMLTEYQKKIELRHRDRTSAANCIYPSGRQHCLPVSGHRWKHPLYLWLFLLRNRQRVFRDIRPPRIHQSSGPHHTCPTSRQTQIARTDADHRLTVKNNH